MPDNVVRFGTFELDRATGELRSRGQRVPLQDQPAQLLSLLVSRPGAVVTREELRKALWSDDTFVEFDTALNVAVNKVRQALRDSAASPRFVETVPKRGYRFLADVHPAEVPAPGPQEPPAPPRRRHPWLAIAAAAGAILTVGLIAFPARSGRSVAGPRSVAVLPFKPLVADARDEALEMGMAEAVIVKLARNESLRVPSIGAVRRYAGTERSPLEAGRELGVDTVLEGSLQRADGRLRVSARLLDVGTETPRWARQWDIPWTDVFTVQDALATEVARELELTLAPAPGTRSPRQSANAEAYDRYLRARHLVTRRTSEDSRRAIELLDEAIALDPAFAPAHAVQADAYLSIPWLGEPLEPYVTRGRLAARRALELDPASATAHATLGTILAQFDWDPVEGERELKRAFELDPDDATVLRFYSVFLWHEARFDEALAVNARELALTPTSAFAHRNKAMILYFARRYEESIAECRRTLELDRFFLTAYGWLSRAYEQLGRDQEAVEAFVAPLTFEEPMHARVASLRAARAQGGMRGFWTTWLAYQPRRSDFNTDETALAWLKAGDRERALGELQRLADQRSPWLRAIRVEPQWDPVRDDPRFQALLRQANLVR